MYCLLSGQYVWKSTQTQRDLHICHNYTYTSTYSLTHTGFLNPHAFGCRVLRGELPAARVVLSNNTLKWREAKREEERGETAQSAEYVF